MAALRCVGAMALRDDVSLLLHQDRRSHALMNYAQRVDRLPPREQLALARAVRPPPCPPTNTTPPAISREVETTERRTLLS